jgi:hypothetical protein
MQSIEAQERAITNNGSKENNRVKHVISELLK